MTPSTSTPQGELERGTIVAGKYRVESVLGRGGVGVVVAATHVQLGTSVAVKILRGARRTSEVTVRRFLREAKTAARLESEHVCRVTDVGTLEDGVPFLVMDLLRGTDLFSLLADKGGLPVEDAVLYVLHACEALAEAHAYGIVHRDLKPSNLFLTTRPDGSSIVKLLDFGVAKPAPTAALPVGPDGEPIESSITRTNVFVGSTLYSSPEQLRDAKTVDARTDIWSLGVVLYELLADAPPFDEPNEPALLLAVARRPPRPLREHRPDVPAGLEQVILRCLEKDREDRFQTVWELATALLPFAPPDARISVERTARVTARTAAQLAAAGTGERSVPEPASHRSGRIEAPTVSLGREASTSPLDLPSSAPARRVESSTVPLGVPLPVGRHGRERWRSRSVAAIAASVAATAVVAAFMVLYAVARRPSPASPVPEQSVAGPVGQPASSASALPTVDPTNPLPPDPRASPEAMDAPRPPASSLQTSARARASSAPARPVNARPRADHPRSPAPRPSSAPSPPAPTPGRDALGDRK